MTTISLNGKWTVKDTKTGAIYPATVPGDIHNDLKNSGVIVDPYYADNANVCGWVTEQDWLYEKTFDVTEDMLKHTLKLVFKGIDTYSEILINGQSIGSTDNMFLQYTFKINEFVKPGENTVAVRLLSIKKQAEQYPHDGYFACFNLERIFMRKAQCHFSWDWAPDLPAMGIWQDVSINVIKGAEIKQVTICPYLDGKATFFIHMVNEKGKYDTTGKALRLKVWDDEQCVEKNFDMAGAKNVVNISVDNAKLWWPKEMGEPHLYNYQVTVIEDGEETYVKNGRFGFRTVELVQHPMGDKQLTCNFKINGKTIFLKGANWIPLDIMTGCIPDDKYRKAIRLAQEANYNCLRIWGGGIYEKDIFFDICDEIGMLVWQDVQFACADIPEDYPGFSDRVIEEVKYQFTRLQTHPSFFVSTGGNEKTGSYGEAKSLGEKLVCYTLRGLFDCVDGTRPYILSSPYSFADIGNDFNSGDTHINSYQSSLGKNQLHEFREVLKGLEAALISEVGVQGSSRIDGLKKYIPEDKLWPVNDIYNLHFTRNPYDGYGGIPFVETQIKAAEILFGEINSVNEFVKKSMTLHSEFVRADAEFHRSRRGNCGGAMFWMFSDIWPSGTWAHVDYYLIPKACYYSSKRAFEPITPIITKTKDQTALYVVNDTMEEVTGKLTLRYVDTKGNIYEDKSQIVTVPGLESVCVMPLDSMIVVGSQRILTATFDWGEKSAKTFYYPDMWKEAVFEDPKLEVSIEQACDKCATLTITATQAFARTVNIEVPDFSGTYISDNFFDMEKGETRVIEIKAENAFDSSDIVVKTWVDEWDR